MDIRVTPASGGKTWHLTDLLGRSMGFIEQDAPRVFIVRPANRAIQTMQGLVRTHPSLDDALKAVVNGRRSLRKSGLPKFPRWRGFSRAVISRR